MYKLFTAICLFAALVVISTPANGQIVQPNRVSTTQGCQSSATQTNNNITYGTVNAQGQGCTVIAASANSSGITVATGVTTSLTTTATNIATLPGAIFGLTVSSSLGTSGTVVWLNFFNTLAASVTAGTTTPLFSIPVIGVTGNANNFIPAVSPIGVPFSALSVNCTTLRNGVVGTQNPCEYTVFRK